ncbi:MULTISPECIES: hypothetical protein [Myxococcus]|nr:MULTISPECIES: hypothetical protein [Myxococcus]WNZ64699.1 hypothetical protein QEG98_14115 [Myxococcus sp. MxC21-1]SDD90093.1 hypothetical protein SAMN04488504_103169 [Myxococcus virescens]
MFTDEVSVPINHWTLGLNLPAFHASMISLWLIEDRASLAAVLVPQLTFVAVSSLQMALIAMGLAWLVQRGRSALRQHRAND